MSWPEPLAALSERPTRITHVELCGLGTHLPAPVVSSSEIAARTGVEESWILARTGIRSRHRAPSSAGILDVGEAAAITAMADAGLDPGDVDLVVFATVSQERPMPNVAPQLAARVGASNAGAFDLGAACNGFITGLATGAAFIEARRANNVLLVAADLLTRQTDPHDRRTAALFGDGAGAAVLRASEDATPWTIELGADGNAAHLLENDDHTGLIRMNGHELYIDAVSRMEQVTRSVCASAGLPLTEVDLFVFHQANARITRALTERLSADPMRVVDSIAEVGNTSAASVPLALEHARGEGRLLGGEKVLLCAVGAGLTWGAALIEWERP